MEDAALVAAHTHARKAAQETARSRLASAGHEHSLAAQDFSQAASATEDAEALRILLLLEEHHQKLAGIVKAREEFTRNRTTTKEDLVVEEPSEEKEDAAATHTGPEAATVPAERSTPPTLPKTRDTPSSLAKDMASRRGIPQSQNRRATAPATNLSPVQASGRMAHPSKHTPGRMHEDAAPFDKTSAATQALHQATPPDAASADDNFTRFYSSLVNGPFSKLSSMLAFASLPLHETSPETSPSASRVAPTSTDITSLVSRAALSALDANPTRFAPAESFYVVPPSYAAIARQQQQKTDAAPTPESAAAPTQTLREEELATENAALKAVLDQLSQRLQAFESHAQDASIALAQSVISTGRGAGAAAPVADEGERVRALRASLEAEVRQREALAKENQRNRQIIAKYRSHWEQLKDSARARREKGEGSGRERPG